MIRIAFHCNSLIFIGRLFLLMKQITTSYSTKKFILFQWIFLCQRFHDCLCLVGCRLTLFDHHCDCLCDLIHIFRVQSAGSYRRSSKTYTTCHKWRFRIVWNGILIAGNVDGIQKFLNCFSGKIIIGQIIDVLAR